MSNDLKFSVSELSGLWDWSFVKLEHNHSELAFLKDRIEGPGHRQQQQISRESELAFERSEALKSEAQKREERLYQIKREIAASCIVFLGKWFDEVKSIVCNGDGLSKTAFASGITAQGIAAGLATSIMNALSIENPVAVGLATVVMIVIGTAGLKAFCAMDKKQAYNVAIHAAYEKFDGPVGL